MTNKNTKKKAAVKKTVKKAVVISKESFVQFSAPKLINNFLNSNFALLTIFMLIFVLGFVTGSLFQENKNLRAQGLIPNNNADLVAEEGNNAQLEAVPEIDDNDHIRGAKNGKVKMIVYSDFECPYCNRFHPTVLKIMEKYGNKISLAFRHYPLSFHPNAQKLAEASECVAEYGSSDAFWKFTDTVFEQMADESIYSDPTNKVVSDAKILSLAQTAGANGQQVMNCVGSGEMKDVITTSMSGASAAGISGTPSSVIISGDKRELIPGALPYESVITIIEKYL